MAATKLGNVAEVGLGRRARIGNATRQTARCGAQQKRNDELLHVHDSSSPRLELVPL
jgi:hypothetical protein